MLTQRKSKYRERSNAKTQKTQRKSKCRFTTEFTEDTEVKPWVCVFMRVVRIKYTDSMYYLHFLHELHGEAGCSLCAQWPLWWKTVPLSCLFVVEMAVLWALLTLGLVPRLRDGFGENGFYCSAVRPGRYWTDCPESCLKTIYVR